MKLAEGLEAFSEEPDCVMPNLVSEAADWVTQVSNGIAELNVLLLTGWTLFNCKDDNKWWLLSDGEKKLGGTATLIELIQLLGK